MKLFVGHIVPLMDRDEKRLWVTEAELDKMERLIRRLKDLLDKSKDYLKEARARGEGTQALADLIVAFLSAPLSMVPLPKSLIEKGKASIGTAPSDIFWIWALGRRTRTGHEIFSSELKLSDLLSKVPKVLSQEESFKQVYEEILGEKAKLKGIRELLLDVFLRVPADTRPPFNSSSLISHLLMTSALVSILARIDGLPREAINILRLAALLHDLGKPESWKEALASNRFPTHAVAGERKAEELLKGLLPDEELELVKYLIIKHHATEIEDEVVSIGGRILSKRTLLHLLRSADRMASSYERLKKATGKVAEVLEIKEDILREMLEKTGHEVWDRWSKLDEDKVKEATEEGARFLASLSDEERPKGPSEEEPRGEGAKVSVLVADIRNIQGFLRREKLPSLVGASYVVELTTLYLLPRAILETYQMPPEVLIYAGGGLVLALIPPSNGDQDEVKKRVHDVLRKNDIGLKLEVYSSEIREDWRETLKELMAGLEAKKLISSDEASVITIGLEESCSFCGFRPAIKEKDDGLICRECDAIWDIGYNKHFSQKYEEIREVYGITLEWKDIKEWILEWLSGVSARDIGEGKRDMRGLAVVKADGNMMGQFMARAVSPVDTKLRSVRVDLSLKQGLLAIYNKLEEKRRNEDIARFYVGTLYTGGDDMMANWPANLSLQASLLLAYHFWKGLGGERQLSIGISVGKPKQNIWALADTAKELLDSCKGKKGIRGELKIREEGYRGDSEDQGCKEGKGIQGELKQQNQEILKCIVGVLAAIYSDSQVPLPSWVEEYVREGREFTSQPLAITTSNIDLKKLGDFWRALAPLCGDISECKEEKVVDIIDKIWDELVHEDQSGVESRTREVKKVVKEVMSIPIKVSGGRNSKEFIAAYCSKRVKEEVEQQRRSYKAIAQAALHSRCSGVIPLLDVFLLAKLVEGR